MFSLLSFSSFFTTSVVSSSLFLSPHSFFSYFRSIRYSLFFSLTLSLSFCPFFLSLSPPHSFLFFSFSLISAKFFLPFILIPLFISLSVIPVFLFPSSLSFCFSFPRFGLIYSHSLLLHQLSHFLSSFLLLFLHFSHFCLGAQKQKTRSSI